MAKTFLLFAAHTEYSAGGMGDYRGAFETLEQARAKAQALLLDTQELVDWVQLVEWTPSGLVPCVLGASGNA